MKNNLLSGTIGLCVGDALGVPVEFNSRASLQENPVTNMRGYGVFLTLLKWLKNKTEYINPDTYDEPKKEEKSA